MRNRKLLICVGITLIIATMSLSGCGNKKNAQESIKIESTQESEGNVTEEPDTVESIDTDYVEEQNIDTDYTEEQDINEDSIIQENLPANDEDVQQLNLMDTVETENHQTIPMDDTLMYCVTNKANIRAGAGTQYDAVGSLTYGQEVTINGRVEDGDKLWYVIKTSDDSVQMVSGSLLSTTKPVAQQNTNNGNSVDNEGNSEQQQPQVQQPQVEEQPSGNQNAGEDWFDSVFGANYDHEMISAEEWYRRTYGDDAWENRDTSWADGITWY